MQSSTLVTVRVVFLYTETRFQAHFFSAAVAVVLRHTHLTQCAHLSTFTVQGRIDKSFHHVFQNIYKKAMAAPAEESRTTQHGTGRTSSRNSVAFVTEGWELLGGWPWVKCLNLYVHLFKHVRASSAREAGSLSAPRWLRYH